MSVEFYLAVGVFFMSRAHARTHVRTCRETTHTHTWQRPIRFRRTVGLMLPGLRSVLFLLIFEKFQSNLNVLTSGKFFLACCSFLTMLKSCKNITTIIWSWRTKLNLYLWCWGQRFKALLTRENTVSVSREFEAFVTCKIHRTVNLFSFQATGHASACVGDKETNNRDKNKDSFLIWEWLQQFTWGWLGYGHAFHISCWCLESMMHEQCWRLLSDQRHYIMLF